MSRTVKDSGIPWIGEIPMGWELKKLKYLSRSIKKGSGITKEDVFPDGDTPCVRYGEIYSKYQGGFEQCISLTKKDRLTSLQFFTTGDILFAGTGEKIEEIGKNIVYSGTDNCLAGGDIIIVSPTQNPTFLNYALNSEYAQAQKSCGKAKLKVVHISATEIGNIRIVLPSLSEQQLIAEFLDRKCGEIDETIALQEEFIEELKAYKQSVITEAVTRGLNSNVKFKDSGIDWIGKIPQEWNVRAIKTLAILKSGTNITTNEITDDGEGYPVYGGNGLRGYYSGYSNDGDFALIGRQGALCGNINYGYGRFWATDHCVVCYPREEYVLRWFGETLRAMNLNQYSLSSAQPGLSVERIKDKLMPVPPLTEQKQIADYLDNKCTEIDSLIAIKQQKIEELKDYKKSVIYEYVTGKKEVK